MAGTLFVVATPIGNLEDITVRALRILREVAVIAAEDTRRTAHLLTKYGITTPTTSLHAHNERQKSSALIARLRAGENVALVSDAGTPTVSDPGSHLIAEAIAQGVTVEPVPGPNAAVTLLSAAGWATDSFIFLGFPPTRAKDRSSWFNRLRDARTTVIFYEAPHRIVRTLEETLQLIGDVPAVVGRELTKAHEELVRGPISAILERRFPARGEFTVALDVGRMPEHVPQAACMTPTDAEIAYEFGLMTTESGRTRRQAIAALARKYGLSAKRAYDAVEQAKKSGS